MFTYEEFNELAMSNLYSMVARNLYSSLSRPAATVVMCTKQVA
jgi:hypothetical protein